MTNVIDREITTKRIVGCFHVRETLNSWPDVGKGGVQQRIHGLTIFEFEFTNYQSSAVNVQLPSNEEQTPMPLWLITLKR